VRRSIAAGVVLLAGLGMTGCGTLGATWQAVPTGSPVLTKDGAQLALLVPDNVGDEFRAFEEPSWIGGGCLENPTDVLDYLGPVEAKRAIIHDTGWPTVDSYAWGTADDEQMAAAFDELQQAIHDCTEVSMRYGEDYYDLRVRPERPSTFPGADERIGYVARGWGRSKGERWPVVLRMSFLRFGSSAIAVQADSYTNDDDVHEGLVELAAHRLAAVLEGRTPALEGYEPGTSA
jgi:hypothetical protein